MTATFIFLGLIYLFPVLNFQSLLLDSSRYSMTPTKYDTSFISNFLSFTFFLFSLMISASTQSRKLKISLSFLFDTTICCQLYCIFPQQYFHTFTHIYFHPPLLVHTFITFHLNSNKSSIISLLSHILLTDIFL